MSIQLLHETLEELPWALREQVISYAESVRSALPGIFIEAEVRYDKEKADKIIYLAGIKKLDALITSNQWVLKSATSLLSKHNDGKIKFGGSDYSREGDFFRNLHRLSLAIESALYKNGAKELLSMSYLALVKADLS